MSVLCEVFAFVLISSLLLASYVLIFQNMEQLKDLKKDRTALGVLCFLATTTILTFVDILCAGAYIGLIFFLLYFTFLKDCLEILTFAIVKCATRLKWLYRIFKIRDLLYIRTEKVESESNVTGNLHNSVSVLSDSCLVQNSPDPVASSSCISMSTFNPSLLSSSQSRNPLQTGEILSPPLFQSPLSSIPGSEESAPRKLSSLSTQIISSTEDFIIDETNFEDVDLSEEKIERELVTPLEESNFTRSSLRWNISKLKLFESFRKNKLTSSISGKSQLGNIAGKVTQALPQRADDKEKLMSNKNDSPEQVGCCPSLPHLLKVKYQSSIAPYTRF